MPRLTVPTSTMAKNVARQGGSTFHASMFSTVNMACDVALTREVSGAINLSAPDPVRQKDFAKALGRALRRPAVLPLPKLALRAAVGELASELTASQRVRPWQGYRFRLGLDEALRASL